MTARATGKRASRKLRDTEAEEEPKGSVALPFGPEALELELHAELHPAEVVAVSGDHRGAAHVRAVAVHVHVVVIEQIEHLVPELDRFAGPETEALVQAEIEVPVS